MKVHLLIYLFLMLPFITLAQSEPTGLDELRNEYKEFHTSPGTSFSTKIIDLDNDNDLDYIFSFGCGEANCLKVHINVRGDFKKMIDEVGSEHFSFIDSQDNQASKLVLNATTNHCCGESPFGSHRSFSFANDEVFIKNNYVTYNYEYYNNEDNYRLTFTPETLLDKAYEVTITADGYNVRFSADLDNHNALFTCTENTNIIATLQKGSTVKVLGEYKGNDHEERTWLYVEIPNEAINDDECTSPISYNFDNQTLRGWISNKYVSKI